MSMDVVVICLAALSLVLTGSLALVWRRQKKQQKQLDKIDEVLSEHLKLFYEVAEDSERSIQRREYKSRGGW